MREACKHCGSTDWYYTGDENWLFSHVHDGKNIYSVHRAAKCHACGGLFEHVFTGPHYSYQIKRAEEVER